MRSPSVPLQQQQAQQMIATSDAGDAFFESNYGTLISRSSAYKTLGYAPPESPGGGQLSQLHNAQLNGVANLSTASSSPNSMTTHHNGTVSGNLNLESIQQNLAMMQGKPAQAEVGESCQETVTVLKTKNTNSSGGVIRTVTTTAAAKNDNGQATHV